MVSNRITLGSGRTREQFPSWVESELRGLAGVLLQPLKDEWQNLWSAQRTTLGAAAI